MKRHLKLLFLLQLAASLLVGCAGRGQAAWSPDYRTGLILTQESKETSEILLLDESGQVISRRSCPYGTMGHFGYQQQVIRDGVLYEAPAGIATKKDFGKIVGFDLKTGEAAEYDFKRDNITALDADGTCLYALSNLNGVTYFDRMNRESGSISTVTCEDIMTLHICVMGGRLYGLGENLDTGRFQLYRVDFEEESRITIKDLPENVTEDPVLLSAFGQQLYFVSGTVLYTYDPASGKLAEKALQGDGGYAAFPYEQTVFVICMSEDYTDTRVELYDRNSLEYITSIELADAYYQMELSEDTLILSSDTALYCYDISNRQNPQLEKSVTFEDEVTGNYIYGGFFINEEN